MALIAMVEELVRFSRSQRFSVWPQLICSQARLAVNSVTLGDYTRPMQIGNFVKELFAGFQLLNLKNDILRKRSDGIKYSVCRYHCNVYSTVLKFLMCVGLQVKKVEDVVYDLSLRNLVPKGSSSA